MGETVAARFLRLYMARGLDTPAARVLVLGFTFKENCPDIRNTRVIDVVKVLAEHGIAVDVHDPWADAADAESEYGIRLVPELRAGHYGGVILAVAHDHFRTLGADGVRRLLAPGGIVFDVKGILPAEASDLRL
jgi:UDP-N-acetyl-D-galactosamine dehydrogenase